MTTKPTTAHCDDASEALTQALKDLAFDPQHFALADALIEARKLVLAAKLEAGQLAQNMTDLR